MRMNGILIAAAAALALAATGCRNQNANRGSAARQNQSGYDKSSSSSANATGTPAGASTYGTPTTGTDTSVENQSGRETSATSGMQTYRVSKVTADKVTLEPSIAPRAEPAAPVTRASPSSGGAANGGGSATGSSERQNQSGKDVTISLTEFQRLSSAGTTSGTATAASPKVGDLVLISMGPSNTPTKIQPLTGSNAPSTSGSSGDTGNKPY